MICVQLASSGVRLGRLASAARRGRGAPLGINQKGDPMFFTSQAPIWQAPVLQDMLKALTTVPAGVLLATPKLELFKAGPQFTGNDTWTAYTKCGFSGYAAAAATIGPPGNLKNLDQACVVSAHFEATGVLTASETAIGYMLSDATANIYLGEFFPQPMAFAIAGDFLSLDVVLPLILRPLYAL
jgi:hypothetical protein